jgi:methyl-accepting chemotaxis protein
MVTEDNRFALLMEELNNVADGIGNEVRLELSEVCQGIGQAEGIVGDAATKIGHSFKSLDQQVREQLSLVSSLIQDLTGNSGKAGSRHFGMQQFTQETTAVLGNFVSFMNKSSRQSTDVSQKIDEISEQMKSIFGMLAKIDAIAQQTNLLALNAAIEAARAGEAGLGFAVVAQEVRALSINSRSLSEEIGNQVNKIRRTVADARSIVSEVAAEDTSAALNASKHVEVMMKDLNDVNTHIENSLGNISSTTGQIHKNIVLAIRALQFEDIVRQLLEYNNGRLETVYDLFEMFLSSLNDLHQISSVDPAAFAGQLGIFRQEWIERIGLLNAEDHKPVLQETMAAGEIELF